MRIIAGEFRGRRLQSPAGSEVRPTGDKVKGAMFSMLYPYMHEGFVAVDLFAGSGNLGLEAISRGAKCVYFSDASRESLALVRTNVRLCRAEERAVLLSGDYKTNLKRVDQQADIIFLDPPYAERFILPALDAIEAAGCLKKGGAVCCEHGSRDVLPEVYGNYTAVRDRRYGASGVTIYEYLREEGDESLE